MQFSESALLLNRYWSWLCIMNVRLPDSWNTPLRPVRWFQIWFHVSNELLTLTLLTIARGIIVFDPAQSDTSRWRESYQCWESGPAVLVANIDAWQTLGRLWLRLQWTTTAAVYRNKLTRYCELQSEQLHLILSDCRPPRTVGPSIALHSQRKLRTRWSCFRKETSHSIT